MTMITTHEQLLIACVQAGIDGGGSYSAIGGRARWEREKHAAWVGPLGMFGKDHNWQNSQGALLREIEAACDRLPHVGKYSITGLAGRFDSAEEAVASAYDANGELPARVVVRGEKYQLAVLRSGHEVMAKRLADATLYWLGTAYH